MAKYHPMIDSEYAAMKADFEACPRPKKWKMALCSERGQRSVVTWDGSFFVRTHLGQTVRIVSVTEAQRMVQSGEANERGRGPINSYAEFFERVDEHHTGNHAPRNHAVRVPTCPGQPVRG